MKAIIVAVDNEWGIGKDGVLPWNLPEDLKRFKELTTNTICIMGYNSYKEIAVRFKYEETGKFLPNRISLVVTSRDIPQLENEKANSSVLSFKSLDAATQWAERFISCRPRPIFYIGGARIFEEALPIVDTIYFTKIHAAFECDVQFPAAIYNKLAFTEEVEKDTAAFTFIKATRP